MGKMCWIAYFARFFLLNNFDFLLFFLENENKRIIFAAQKDLWAHMIAKYFFSHINY